MSDLHNLSLFRAHKIPMMDVEAPNSSLFAEVVVYKMPSTDGHVILIIK